MPPPAPAEAPRDVAALSPASPSVVPDPPPPAAAPDVAALPPAPDGFLPPPAPPAEAAPAPPPPPPEPADVTEETPRETAAAPETPADALPLPPLPPPADQPSSQAQPAQRPSQPRQQQAARQSQAPIRLDAGAEGPTPEGSLGAFALGAAVPPGPDPGYRNAPPDYPAEARRRGEEGVVRLAVSVAPDGQVTRVEVALTSGFPALDRAALEAAQRWRFRPATRAGLPVAGTLTTAVHFRLQDGRGR
nr:energy transducer TonB [Neoroseomonas alba]